MYQSFPQTSVYTKKENAMPKMPHREAPQKKKSHFGSLFSGLEADDIIVIGILLILLSEDSDDFIPIALLAFLLFF